MAHQGSPWLTMAHHGSPPLGIHMLQLGDVFHVEDGTEEKWIAFLEEPSAAATSTQRVRRELARDMLPVKDDMMAKHG